MRILNVKWTPFSFVLNSILALTLSGCFGSGNEEAATDFGILMEIAESQELIPVGSVDNVVKVRLFDKKGKPASGMDVIFTYLGTSDLLIENQVVTTDASGYAATSFRAPGDIKEGEQIRMKVRDLAIEQIYTFNTISAGPAFPTKVRFKIAPSSPIQANLESMDDMPAFTVEVLDQYNKPYVPDTTDVDPDPVVQVEVGVSLGTNTFLSGTKNLGLSNSVAVFSDMAYSKAEIITIQAKMLRDGSIGASVTSQPITVEPNNPFYVASLAPGQSLNSGYATVGTAITQTASPQRAGVNFDATTYILDRAFNVSGLVPVTGYSVSFTPANSVNIINQVAIADGQAPLRLEPKVAGASFTISPAANQGSALTVIPSAPISVGAGFPNRLRIAQQASSTANAGVPFVQKLRVEVLDKYFNLVNDATNRISVSAFTDTCVTPVTSAARLKNFEADAVAGVAEFTSLNYESAEIIYLKGSSAGLNASDCSTAIDVSAGAAALLAWQAKPSNNSQQVAGVQLSPSPIVRVTDAFGNKVSVAVPVEIKVYSDGACQTPIDAQTPSPVAATSRTLPTSNTVAGDASFTAFRVNLAGNGFYIQADNGSLFTTCAGPINFLAGAANALVFAPDFPTTHQAHLAFSSNPSVRVIDQYGNTKASAGQEIDVLPYDSSVGLCQNVLTGKTYSGGAGLSIASGSVSLSGFRYRNSGNVRFGAVLKNTSVVGCSSNITAITSGPANQLAWVQALPANVVATQKINDVGNTQVRVTDEWGNPVEQSVDVEVTAHTDSLCTLNAESTIPKDSTLALEYNTTTTNAGTGIGSFPNLAYRRAREIYFKATATSVTLPGANPSPCSSKVTIGPGSATLLKATTSNPAGSISADNFITPTPVFQLNDTYGNILKSSGAKISLTAKSTGCSGAASTTFENNNGANKSIDANGNATFASLAYRKVESIGIEATTDAPGVTGFCWVDTSITAGAPKKLEFTDEPTAGPSVAGTNFASPPVKVRLTDNWANPVSDDSFDVSLSVFHDGACTTGQEGAGVLTGGNPTDTFSGIATFSNLSYTKARTNLYLKAFVSGNATITTDCSQSFAIKHAAPNNLKLASGSSLPATQLVTSVFPSFSLELFDQYSNLVNTGGPYALNVEAYSDSGCSTEHFAGTQTPNAGFDKFVLTTGASSAGVFTVSDLRYRVTGSVKLKFWIDGQVANASPGALCAPAFTAMQSATATSVVWNAYPINSPNSADTVFSTQPSLGLIDVYGNNITSTKPVRIDPFTDSTCSTPGLAAKISNNTTTSNASGIASFTNLAYRKSGTVYLNATVDGNASLTNHCLSAAPVAVSAGAIAKLVVASQPSANANAGTALPAQPSLEIQDAWDNVKPVSEAILFSVHENDNLCGAGTLRSSTRNGANDAVMYSAVTSSNGIATASDLRILFAATQMNLKAYLNTDNSKSVCFSGTNVKAITPTTISLAAGYTVPSNTRKADELFPNMTFTLKDVYGNTAKDTSHDVIVDFFTDVTCGTTANNTYERGTYSKSTTTGEASFANLQYVLAGSTVYFNAVYGADTNIKTSCSSATSITPGTPAKIIVTQQPSVSGVAGTTLVQSPSIKITDAYDNDTTLGTAVNIEPMLNGNATCTTGTLINTGLYTYTNKGTTSTSNGSIAFAGLRVDQAGTYRLKFTAPNAVPAIPFGCSSADLVIAPAVANKIVITSTLPTTRRASQTFSIDARVEDTFGNVINDANGSGPVTAAYFVNGSSCTTAADTVTPNATAAYTGASATATNGVMSFASFGYRKTGDYQIKLSGLGVESACLGATASSGNLTSGKMVVEAADPSTIELPSLGASRVATSPWTNLNFTVKDPYGNLANKGAYGVTFEVFEGGAACTVSAPSTTQTRLVTTPANFSISGGTTNLSSLQMQRAGNWRLKANLTGYSGVNGCWPADVSVTPGAPVKVAWASGPNSDSGPSTNGETLLAGQNLTSLSNEIMPRVAITDTYGNVNGSVSNEAVTFKAYTDPSCSGASSIDNTPLDVNGTFTDTLSVTIPQIAGGVAEATSFVVKTSHTSSIYFIARTNTYGDSPCSPTGLLVQPNSLSFLRLRSTDGNKGVVIADGSSYNNIDPVFWAAGYDVYGNFRADQSAATWTLYNMNNLSTAIVGMTAATGATSTLQSTVTNTGSFRVKAVVGAVEKSVDNIVITLQSPVGFRVTLVGAPGGNNYTAGSAIQVLIQAIDAQNAVVSTFQGLKTIKLTHNQGANGANAADRPGGCAGTVTNNYIQENMLFTNGETNYTMTNGLRFAQAGAVITATTVGLPSYTGASPALNILAGAHACVKMMTPTNTYYGGQGYSLDSSQIVKLASVDTYGNYIADVAGSWSTTGNFQGYLQGDQSSANTSVTFFAGRAGSGNLQVSSAQGSLSVTLFGSTPSSDKTFSSSDTAFFRNYSLRNVSFYDSVNDSLTTEWRHDAASSWHLEGGTATTVRGAKREFPAKSLLVSTDLSLEVIDATQNSLWMRFNAASSAAVDSTRGRPVTAAGLNGKVAIGLKNSLEDRGSLVIADFKRDRIYRLRSHPTDASDSMLLSSVSGRNSSSGWTTSTVFPVPASLVVNNVALRRIASYDYLAVGTKTGVLVYRMTDNFSPVGPVDTFTVGYARHGTTGSVNAVKITSDGSLYYTVDGVGIFKAGLGSITYAADSSGSFTGTELYNSTSQRASLTQSNFTALDVMESSSINSGYNLISVGTDKGVILVHEGSSNTTAQSRYLTYRGAGPQFFNNVAEFDGVNDSISIPYKSSMPAADGGVDLWFRPDDQVDSASTPTQTLFYRGAGGAGSTPFTAAGNIAVQFVPGGKLHFTYGVGSGAKVELPSIRSQWFKGTRYHVRIAWSWLSASSLKMSLWVNGSLEASSTATGVSKSSAIANTAGIFLGGSITGSPSPLVANQQFFAGAIDELLVRNIVPENNLDDPIDVVTAEFSTGETGAAYLFHFNEIWDTTTSAFGVAVDSISSTSNGSFKNGATSSYPVLAGFSRAVSQVAGVANASTPKLMVSTQYNQGYYSEISNLHTTPTLSDSRNIESNGFTIYHVESTTDSDVALIQRDQNLVLIRR
jgi:hypothetical protein